MKKLLAGVALVAATVLGTGTADAHHDQEVIYSYGEFQTIADHHPPDRIDIYYAGWRPFTYIWADCANRGGTSYTQSWFPGFSLYFCLGIDY